MSTSEKLALYRQWRPQNFRDVVAQEQVVYPLLQSVRNGRFAHAFLFSGTRGTGKTSVAKIFAKAVNCLNPDDGNPCNECEICVAANNGSLMDIQEIDAASNNGVDDVRRLTSEIIFSPVLARYKVYIIDEAHMLSQQAFNALLKTLEEPPAHAVFILATTEPHRIPATIMSRCQHYEFRRIKQSDIVRRLRLISDELGLSITDDALSVIAQLANGGMRDAISLLDQLHQMPGEIGRDDVLQMAGRVPDQFLHSVAAAILDYDADTLLSSIQELVMSGRDLTRFLLDLSAYMRNLLIVKVSRDPAELIQMTSGGLTRLSELADCFSTELISDGIASLARLNSELRFSPDIRTSLEIGLLALASRLGGGHLAPVKSVVEKAPEVKVSLVQETPAREEASQPEVIIEAEIKQTTEKTDSVLEKEEAESSLAYEDETLRIWQDVLEAIKEEHLMDLSLMARPAKVSRKDKVWTLAFDHSLKGQHACTSEAESREIIRRILADKLGESVQLEVILEDEADANAVSAEEDWVLKLKKITDKRSIPLHIDEELLKGGSI
ncbi:MAG TPA: DNA polymerase III subunit gamma/tau [Oscillospiraceae bacterium]|nr:DNA polymerase III subunit gamma/tau [Oscillospiraceae bacterium]